MNGCTLTNIQKEYQLGSTRINALKDINLTIERGSFVSLVGYSGCGKTSLLKTIGGLLTPDAGTIRFSGMRGRSSIVFQEPRLISSRSIENNMRLALKHLKDREEKEQILKQTLQLLDLSTFRNARPWQLSGGMAQRAALGRALCRQPELLLMDEPFGALDAFTRSRLQQELIQLYQKQKLTILFVTHDISEAVLLGGRVLIMAGGSILRDITVPLTYPRSKTTAEFISIHNEVLTSLTERQFCRQEYSP